MKRACAFTLMILAFAPGLFAQTDLPIIKAEVKSAFVWGEDSATGATSSSIQDPLTGNAVHKLSYGGIEVSSRMGFERGDAEELGTYVNYVTTIVNSTDSEVSVRYGGSSIDGRAASPLVLASPDKKLTKRERKNKQSAVELAKMHCFTSGFLPTGSVFSTSTPSQILTVEPGAALTVSTVIRDPRLYHAIRYSIEGCYPTGSIRYYLTINSQDYVFVWAGRSAIYCGV
jgi:hypothetical protein